MQYHVEKSSLQGTIAVTTSKSHTMRAILLASMARGKSVVRHPLPSPDAAAMIVACRAFGADIQELDDRLEITGTGGNLTVPKHVIDVGNSGQVLRFGAAMTALLPLYSIFTGDESVVTIRPMQPLLDGLTQLGAFAVSTKNDGHAPIIIKGPAKAGKVVMDGADSQPVSAILLLGSFLEGTTTIDVINAGEKPWIDLTLYWLDKFNIQYTNDNYDHYTVTGKGGIDGFDFTIPGDWSSAAFPIAASLVTNSPITLDNMDMKDPQGDKAIVEVFQQMGARFNVNDGAKTLEILPHHGLHGVEINVNKVIDAVPIIATVACFADSPTTITGAAIARRKESDRLSAITEELTKMGAHIDEFEDGLTIHPATLHGATVNSRHDHRIAMALAVAGLTCGDTTVESTNCVAKSFPGFAAAMGTVGARIKEEG